MPPKRARQLFSNTPTKQNKKSRYNDEHEELSGMESDHSDFDAEIADSLTSEVLSQLKMGRKNQEKKNPDHESSQSSSQMAGHTSADLAEISAQVIQHILPAIVKAVTSAVRESIRAMNSESQKLNTSTFQRQTLLLRYDNDRMEQYSRRETIRILGVSESVQENEDVVEKVVQICKDIDVTVNRSDISACHRNPWKRTNMGKPRPILCKFVSRMKFDEVMANKKKMKDLPQYKGKVFVNEDITPLRAKMVKYAKDQKNVKAVYTVRGIIKCVLHDGKKINLENPDDFFKLGLTSIDYSALGLAHYMSASADAHGEE
jgi:hypothetical protein